MCVMLCVCVCLARYIATSDEATASPLSPRRTAAYLDTLQSLHVKAGTTIRAEPCNQSQLAPAARQPWPTSYTPQSAVHCSTVKVVFYCPNKGKDR